MNADPNNPERLAAEERALREFVGQWQEHAAPEPTPAAWDRTLNAIERRLAAPPTAHRRSLALRIGGGLAAACLVGLLLARLLWPAGNHTIPPTTEPDEEPYAVARADEIVVITMDPHNAPNLVVGRPPIAGELELAGVGEITLVDAQANDEGQIPQMHIGNVPVILPTESWGGKED